MLRARDLGWDVAGAEHSDATAAAARARGLSVMTDDWETQMRPSAYELIVLNHVLEHVTDPRHLLETLAGALATGGHLHIGLPDFGCVQSRVFGGAWWANLPPEHLWFFERRHVTALVTLAGLEPVEWHDLNRLASLLQLSIWRQQWAVWRVSGGDALGFASRTARCFRSAIPDAAGNRAATGISTMYTLVCARA